MPIDGIRVDEPFYFSSAGASDEVKVEHNGSDFYIINDTGSTFLHNTTAGALTIIDNGVSNNQFVVNHLNGNVGIGTSNPSYSLEAQKTGVGAMIVANRTDGATMELAGAAGSGIVGTRTAHPVDIRTNIVSRINIDISGNVKIPAAYVTTIGGTNADLYIDSTGLIGPNPSSVRFKENIREPADIDTNWIYNVDVKKYDMKPEQGGQPDNIGVIAEQVATVNDSVILYGVHEIIENETPKLLNNSQYDLSQTAALLPGIERNDIPIYRKTADLNGNDIQIMEYKTLQLLPISVKHTAFIMPILRELQKLRTEVDTLKNG